MTKRLSQPALSPRRRSSNALLAAVAAGLVVTLAACGGGGGGGTETPSQPNITPVAGGTVTSANGKARLSVPAGAASAPMTVTLAAAPDSELPPHPNALPGSAYFLDGDGGALGADAILTLETGIRLTEGAIRPAAAALDDGRQQALAASGSPRALELRLSSQLCDLDRDGDVDLQDILLASEANSPCFGPPALAYEFNPGNSLPGITLPPCLTPDRWNTLQCRLRTLSRGRLGILFDSVAPTIGVIAFDFPVAPAKVTTAGTYSVAFDASDNQGVTRVEIHKLWARGNLGFDQTLASVTAPPYTTSFALDAGDNGELYVVGTAFDAVGNSRSRAVKLLVEIDAVPPQVSLATSSATATVGQSVTLSASPSDNVGVARVEFLRGAQKIGEVTAAPWQFVTPTFVSADIGTVSYTARAVDTANNAASSAAVSVLVSAPVPDTAPPVVSLTASATSALVGQSLTLSATANDNVGITRVDFLKNGVKFAEDTSAPFEAAPAVFTSADIGTLVFTATAFDAANNQATSGAVNVVVSAVQQAGEVFVNAASGNDAGAGTSAAPFKTLAKAFAAAGAGGTVWLQNGLFTATGEGLQGPEIFTGRTLPAGLALKAVNDGGATLGFPLRVPAGGTITGIEFDASGNASVNASGGTLVISRPRWVKLGLTSIAHGINATGSAKVLLDPKGNASHNYVGGGLTGFASATDDAELTINGGVIEGSTGQASGAIVLDGKAKASLANLTIGNSGAAWVGGAGVIGVNGTHNVLTLTSVSVDLVNAGAACILQDRQSGGAVVAVSITLVQSTLHRCGGGGVQLREGAPGFSASASQITASGRFGIEAGQIGFDSGTEYGKPLVSLTNTTISGNALGGISLNNGGSLSLSGSTVQGPGHGVQLLSAKPYQLLLRGTALQSAGDGVVLQGDAASSFDLGTSASPGGNTFAGIGGSHGVRVSVAAGVTVLASGNTWSANVQGASGAGQYSTASSVCNGTNPCEVTSGLGANFGFVGAGAGAKLRLAP